VAWTGKPQRKLHTGPCHLPYWRHLLPSAHPGHPTFKFSHLPSFCLRWLAIPCACMFSISAVVGLNPITPGVGGRLQHHALTTDAATGQFSKASRTHPTRLPFLPATSTHCTHSTATHPFTATAAHLFSNRIWNNVVPSCWCISHIKQTNGLTSNVNMVTVREGWKAFFFWRRRRMKRT